MSLIPKVIRRLKLYRDRFVYEVRRPELSAAQINARLDPEHGIDARASGGFTSILRHHLSSAPAAPRWDAADGDADPGPGGVDWHLEPHFGVRWPRRLERSISDLHPGSDMVLLWHKNKMMFLFDVAERYAATAEERYAQTWFRAVDSWCRQNPYMVGKNWRSPMEAGTRLAVWSYSLSQLRDAAVPDEPVCARMIRSVVRQADFLAGGFSHKELPNNHLIGEAATLYVFATYWTIFHESAQWRQKAESVIVQEVERQVLDDGFDYENSVNYHLYVIDFLLLYLHAKGLRGETPPDSVVDATARLIDAALALVSPAGRFPQVGDDSMTEFIALRSLGEMGSAPAPGSTVCAADMVRPGFVSAIGGTPWGRALMERKVELHNAHYFADAGVAAIRGERSHATFVSGPQHARPFSPGHLHLDDGSFELEVGGVPVFVDSGTYLYTYDLAARYHFKGASAHNTLLIDDREPVESEQVFGWDTIHKARTVCFHRFDAGALVVCERDLPSADGTSFLHRRHFLEVCASVGGAGGHRLWLVADRVVPVGSVEPEARPMASALFHTALPASAVTLSEARGARKMSLRLPGAAKELYVDIHSTSGHDVELIDAADDKRCWYSRWYGDLSRGVTFRTRAPAVAGCCLLHVIRPADASVRLDEWGDGNVELTVMSDGPPRSVALRLDTSALVVDKQTVFRGSDEER